MATVGSAPLDLNQPSAGDPLLQELNFEATSEMGLSLQTQGWAWLSPYQRIGFAGSCSLGHSCSQSPCVIGSYQLVLLLAPDCPDCDNIFCLTPILPSPVHLLPDPVLS